MTDELRRKLRWNVAMKLSEPLDIDKRDLAELLLSGPTRPIDRLNDYELLTEFVEIHGSRPGLWIEIVEQFTLEEEAELVTLVNETFS
jgi:hypothetical protein